MILLGYAAMVAIGLLPLAAVARMTGVEGERAFFLPVGWALVLAFLLGLGACLAVGRVLGLLRFEDMRSYQEQRDPGADPAFAPRRRRRLPLRGRRGRAARAER
ncbi:MAG: hypothetical protein WD058_09760 [Dehalococcoidia bacterium]